MNKVCLVGRLVRDPEVRYSAGENATAICRFSVAVDRRFKREGDEQTADFINIVSFGKTAEFIQKYFTKGQRIGLAGRIQTGKFTNKDGQTVYTTDVIAEEVEFVESKKSGNETGSSSKSDDSFSNVSDEVDGELPFN